MASQRTPQQSQYTQTANRYLPRMQAYQKYAGGDLEGAFQQTTGQPWMEGKGLKVGEGGQAEMTNDRGLGSVLKWLSIPAALGATAVFAPGALPVVGKALTSAPALFGAGMGALTTPGGFKQRLLGAGLGAGVGALGAKLPVGKLGKLGKAGLNLGANQVKRATRRKPTQRRSR